MAAKKETYDLIFAGVDKVTPEMKAIISAFEKLDKTVKKTGKELDEAGKKVDISDRLKKLDSGISGTTGFLGDMGVAAVKTTTALAALAVGGIALAVKSFADFQDVMLKVKGITGANAEEYEKLTDLTKKLGAETRFSAKEAAEGLQFLAQAGFDVEKSTAALPEVLNLAAAAALDLGRTADIVTNIMTGYGVEAKDLAKTNDILVSTFTGSNTNLDQLGKAFEFVGPVAKSLGIDFKETAAAIGLLGNAGYQGEKGGTALRNILLALVAPTTNMEKLVEKLGINTEEFGIDLLSSRNALKSLGIEVKGADGALKPLSVLFADLKTKLDEIPSSADRSATAVTIFGKRGGPQLLGLLGQGSEALDKFKVRLNNSEGAAKKLADEMESGVGGALRSLNSAWEGFLIEFGENVKSSPITGLAEVFRTAIKEIDAGTFKPIFDVINEIGGELSKTFEAVAKNLPNALEGIDFSGLTDAIKEITKSLSGLFGVDDLSNVTELERAIQKVVDTVESLIKFTDGFIDSFKPVIALIDGLVSAFNALPASVKEGAGAFAGAAAQLGALVASGTAAALAIKAVGFAFQGSAISSGVASLGALNVASLAAKAGLVGLAAAAGVAIGTLLRQIPGLDEYAQKIIGIAVDGKKADFKIGESEAALKSKAEAVYKYQRNIREATKAQEELGDRSEKTIVVQNEAWKQLNENILKAAKVAKDVAVFDGLKIEIDTNIKGADEALKKTSEISDSISKIDFAVEKLTARKRELELGIKIGNGATPQSTIDELESIEKKIGALTQEKSFVEIELRANDAVDGVRNLRDTLRDDIEAKHLLQFELQKKGVGEVKAFLAETTAEGKYITLNPEFDKPAVDKVDKIKKKLKEDAKFLLKIETKKFEEETKRIEVITKQAGETARKALEVKAKVDIAQAVADTKKFTSIMESTTSIVTELSGAIGTMFGQFSKDLDFYQMKLLEESIRQQIRIQDEAAEGQKELINLELEKRRLQNEFLRNPDKAIFEIKFESDVEPALEYLLRYMLQKTRIFGTNYGVNQLLEVPI